MLETYDSGSFEEDSQPIGFVFRLEEVSGIGHRQTDHADQQDMMVSRSRNLMGIQGQHLDAIAGADTDLAGWTIVCFAQLPHLVRSFGLNVCIPIHHVDTMWNGREENDIDIGARIIL